MTKTERKWWNREREREGWEGVDQEKELQFLHTLRIYVCLCLFPVTNYMHAYMANVHVQVFVCVCKCFSNGTFVPRFITTATIRAYAYA